ncbi:MAG: TIGR02710 family CRISPR-associated CARF protein [Candidatus Omnitrophica bacterium]|nr:TIGR02710 family CRISPR-associated CARF protein [Candidatus Omnitrophota bacterium]
MSKVLIITVGVGERVEHAICCSIRQHNPEYIVLMCTEKSRDEKLPLILADKNVAGRKYNPVIIKDENDVEHVRQVTLKTINELLNSYDSSDIAIDYTSGTKSMSAGVVIAGLERRIGSLIYIYGTRNKNGRVISGTEKIISFEPNRTYVEYLFREAINSFNSWRFDVCLQQLKEASSLVLEPVVIDKIDILERLAKGYSFWDCFNLEEAFHILDGLELQNNFLREWGIKSKIEKNKEFLYKESKNKFCIERGIDLFENAQRRAMEYKFDDAVARLYRCLEYIAQLKIFERGLYSALGKEVDTENLDIDKLPSSLKDKYIKKKDERDGKIRLGIYEDYQLLFLLDDPLGKLFMDDFGTDGLNQLLSIRNSSILAHGFSPVKEEVYKKMLNKTKKFLETLLPNTEDLLTKANFPRLKIVNSLFD